METKIINEIMSEIDNAFSQEEAVEIGILTIKTANRTVSDASTRPDPAKLYKELWYEGEVCCLFADSNLGKSIFAVQMADEIALTRNVLYVDCELSDKQFQLRYCNQESGERHLFPRVFTGLKSTLTPSASMGMRNALSETSKPQPGDSTAGLSSSIT